MAVDTQGKSAWTGKDVSEREINLLNQRVIQFTDIEDTFLDVWLQLENANLDELAAKVINAGLLFEHYLSQLPNDPTQRSPEEIAQLETYRSDAGSALDEGRAALASTMTTVGGRFKHDVKPGIHSNQNGHTDILVLSRLSRVL